MNKTVYIVHHSGGEWEDHWTTTMSRGFETYDEARRFLEKRGYKFVECRYGDYFENMLYANGAESFYNNTPYSAEIQEVTIWEGCK